MLVDSSMRFLEKQRKRAHERVTKTAEVSAILHFLDEDATGFTLAGNVENLDFVSDPFTKFGFIELEMANTLGGEVTGPVNHGFVMFVKNDLADENDVQKNLEKKGFSVLGWVCMESTRDQCEAQDMSQFNRKSPSLVKLSKFRPHFTRIEPSEISCDDTALEKYHFDASSLLEPARLPK